MDLKAKLSSGVRRPFYY